MSFSKVFAISIALLALIWIGSGFIFPSSPASVSDEAQTQNTSAHQDNHKPRVTVQVLESTAQDYVYIIDVTGRTQASQSVELRAETEGRLVALLKEEGDMVREGDLLARLDMRDRDARVKEAQDRVRQRTIEYNAAQKLEERGFNSTIRLSQAKADLEAAKSALRLAEVSRSQLNIHAPINGTISQQNIERGDYVSIGSALFTIVDLSPIEVVGFVSERYVQDIKKGNRVDIELLGGEIVNGTVSYVSPAANADTRTFRVHVSVENEDLRLKGGLTAELRIPITSKKAHKISPSILTLDDEGHIGVKIVDEGQTAFFRPVKILEDKPDGMWISGLPEKASIITVGQEFVMDGQSVETVMSSGTLAQ